MRKKFLYVSTMAAMLASCTTDTFQSQEASAPSGPAIPGKTEIGFNTYIDRGITRSGSSGELANGNAPATPAENTVYLGDEGFGVFAYYTDAADYSGQTKPNFMYNQKVSLDASKGGWNYEPVKYWPNEYGDNAESRDQDRVSFFAYAPYVQVDPTTGKATDESYGITGMSRNSSAGDPIVKYITSMNIDQQVDLCFGTVTKDNQDAQGFITWGTLAKANQKMEAGKPWIDVEHPADISQKMKFDFQHALAALNVQIDLDTDLRDHEDGDQIDRLPDGETQQSIGQKTKVFVRSITFSGFAQKGALNLNNQDRYTPRWMNYSGQGELTCENIEAVTVNDGRKNGSEGVKENANEKNPYLNPSIIQSTNFADAVGVNGDFANLFGRTNATTGKFEAAGPNDAIYVIPAGDEPLTVTIVYDVETQDDNLSSLLSDGTTHGSSIQNKITKEISFNGSGLQAGYKHYVKLHIGLTSVKFDASVASFVSNADHNSSEWLPANKGKGFNNPNNPLTLNALTSGNNPSGKTLPASGDAATDITIPGVKTVSGTGTVPNVLTISSGNPSNITVDDFNVGGLTSVNPAPSRRGTRTDAADLELYSSLSNVTNFYFVPKRPGIVTLTATDENGNMSSTVIAIVGTEMVLNASTINLYKFAADATDADKKSVDVQLIVPKSLGIEDEDIASVEVFTKEYYNGDTKMTNSDKESHQTDVIYAPEIANGDGENAKVVKFTPVGQGYATVTIKSKYGAEQSLRVNVNKPSITVNNSSADSYLMLELSKTHTLTWSTSPALDENLTINSECSIEDGETGACPITFDPSTGKITPSTTGKGKITFTFNGHTEEGDPKVTVHVIVTDGPLDKMKADALESNALWKVAEFNVDGTGQAFVPSHSTAAQNVFTWADMKSTVSISGYHIPTYEEQVSVIPSDYAESQNKAGTNIFSKTGMFSFPQTDDDEAPEGNVKGVFYKAGNGDYYAVRNYGEGKTATAWHYKWTTSPCNGLLIESYVLSNEIKDMATAKGLVQMLPTSTEWKNNAKNLRPTATNSTSSLVSRFLPACGYTDSTTGIADKYVGSDGGYWSASPDGGTKAFSWRFNSGSMLENYDNKTYGFSVRLFRD